MRWMWTILDALLYRQRNLDFTLDEKRRKAWIFGNVLRKIL